MEKMSKISVSDISQAPLRLVASVYIRIPNFEAWIVKLCICKQRSSRLALNTPLQRYHLSDPPPSSTCLRLYFLPVSSCCDSTLTDSACVHDLDPSPTAKEPFKRLRAHYDQRHHIILRNGREDPRPSRHHSNFETLRQQPLLSRTLTISTRCCFRAAYQH